MSGSGRALIHPQGIQVEIVGIDESNRGRNCSNHHCCGSILAEDTVVRLRCCQIVNDTNEEEEAVEAVWVTGGIDSCRIGFLPRYYLPDKDEFHGKLAQISYFLKNSNNKKDLRKNGNCRGVCRAHIIDAEVVYGGEEDDEEGDVKSYDSSKDEEVDSPPPKRSRGN